MDDAKPYANVEAEARQEILDEIIQLVAEAKRNYARPFDDILNNLHQESIGTLYIARNMLRKALGKG